MLPRNPALLTLVWDKRYSLLCSPGWSERWLGRPQHEPMHNPAHWPRQITPRSCALLIYGEGGKKTKTRPGDRWEGSDGGWSLLKTFSSLPRKSIVQSSNGSRWRDARQLPSGWKRAVMLRKTRASVGINLLNHALKWAAKHSRVLKMSLCHCLKKWVVFLKDTAVFVETCLGGINMLVTKCQRQEWEVWKDCEPGWSNVAFGPFIGYFGTGQYDIRLQQFYPS